MKKILSILLVVAMAFGVMTGCAKTEDNGGGSEPIQNSDTTNNSTEQQEQSENNKIIINHEKGQIKLEEPAKKIVVFDMGMLDTISELAPNLELAAPVDNIPSSITNLENVVNAGSIKEPDLEAIFNFEPDLIIISGRQEDYYEELSKIAPTMYIKLDAATYIDDFMLNNTNLAKAIGMEDKVIEYFDAIEAQIKTIVTSAEKSKEKALIILTNDGNLSAYGTGSRFGIIHDVLQFKQADESIQVSTHGQEASYEYISSINPDILFVVDRTVIAGGSAVSSDTLNNDLVNGTNAGKNGKIVYLDAEAWYLAGGGLNTIKTMLDDVQVVFK